MCWNDLEDTAPLRPLDFPPLRGGLFPGEGAGAVFVGADVPWVQLEDTAPLPWWVWAALGFVSGVAFILCVVVALAK